MNFKRKKTKSRWIAFCGCKVCAVKLRQVPNSLKLPPSDRKRYQSAGAQLRCDATGSKPSFRYHHKSLTGIIIDELGPVFLDEGVESGDSVRAIGNSAILVQVGLDLQPDGFRHCVEDVRDLVQPATRLGTLCERPPPVFGGARKTGANPQTGEGSNGTSGEN